jgi:general stress protein 26
MDKATNLSAREAAKKANRMIEDIRFCMFFTNVFENEEGRPMAVAKSDESGRIWFISNKNSHKIKAIQKDERVHLVFSHPGKEMYLDIYGDASLSMNQDEIEELWTPLAKSWLPEGKSDPNICVICVKIMEGNYWDTQHGKMVTLIKMISSALIGKSAVEGVNGELVLTN